MVAISVWLVGSGQAVDRGGPLGSVESMFGRSHARSVSRLVVVELAPDTVECVRLSLRFVRRREARIAAGHNARFAIEHPRSTRKGRDGRACSALEFGDGLSHGEFAHRLAGHHPLDDR